MLFINEIQYFDQNINNIKFRNIEINCGLRNIQIYPLYESSYSFSFSFFSSYFNIARSGTREEEEDKVKLNENLKNLILFNSRG